MTLTGWATFTNPYSIFWGGIRYGPKPCVGRTEDRHYLSKFYIFSEAWITTQYFVTTFELRTILDPNISMNILSLFVIVFCFVLTHFTLFLCEHFMNVWSGYVLSFCIVLLILEEILLILYCYHISFSRLHLITS